METDQRAALPPPAPPAPISIDPALQARLARLNAGRVPRDATSPSAPQKPVARQRRHHAAKGSRTAAVLMSISTTAGLTAYFEHVDAAAASSGSSTLTGAAVASGTAATASTAATATTAVATTSAAATSSTTVAATASTTAASTASTTSTASTLADGTYTGATANNRYGPVQVQIVVSGGKITSATAVQTPTDDRKSVSINERATPTLASEVLSAQSANIDTVSGATYTSDSYKASLQSAIDLAQSTAAQAASS